MDSYEEVTLEFTLSFFKLFWFGLQMAAPILISIALMIVILGQIVGARESWNKFDSLYWSFITATTVGYGDMRPTAPLSKALAVLIALLGLIFTGIMVALAVHTATSAFSEHHDVVSIKENIQHIKQ